MDPLHGLLKEGSRGQAQAKRRCDDDNGLSHVSAIVGLSPIINTHLCISAYTRDIEMLHFRVMVSVPLRHTIAGGKMDR
jgi:hypothetical protein